MITLAICVLMGVIIALLALWIILVLLFDLPPKETHNDVGQLPSGRKYDERRYAGNRRDRGGGDRAP